MRSARKTREQAMEKILAMLSANPDTRFKPAYLSSNLQIGRERTSGLLQALQDDGKVFCDSRGWFVSSANHESLQSHSNKSQNEVQFDARAWIVIGHIGGNTRVTIEFADKAPEMMKGS